MKNLKRMLIFAYIGIVTWLLYLQQPATKHPLSQEEVKSINQKCFDECLEDMVTVIAFIEGFSSTPYFCNVWTIGYGSTYIDGVPVTKDTPAITKEKGILIVKNHLKKEVKPYINCIAKPLTKGEMISTASFIYSIGGGYFKKSEFLKAINQGLPPKECAHHLGGFCKIAGETSDGLKKRRWVEGVIYLSLLTPKMILDLKPTGLYNLKAEFYNPGSKKDAKGNPVFDFSHTRVKQFIAKTTPKKGDTVKEII